MKIDVPDEQMDVLLKLSDRILRAQVLHPGRYPTMHHALGVAVEEFDEFKDEVKQRQHDSTRIEQEALDVMAVMARTVMHLCPNKPHPAKPAKPGKRGAR